MKNNHSRNRSNRKPLLSSIGLAVVATLIASGAHAADTMYGTAPGTERVNGAEALGLLQQNEESINALNNESNVGQSYEANGPTSGGSTGIVGDNVIGARAIGNDFANSIGLALNNTEPGESVQEGSSILGRSINTGDITSQVYANTLSISQVIAGEDGEPNSFTIDDNSIFADTFGNRGVSLIAGPLPMDFTSDVAGSAALTGSGFNAAGGIVVTSAQENNANATASAGNISDGAFEDGNTIELQLSSDGINTEESSVLLTNNAISATVRGNRADNGIEIESGAPTFTGSAVVSNLQSGIEADSTATNRNSTINALIDSSDGGPNTLAGAVTVNNNAISSAATGNDALGSTALAGNRIFLDGMSFEGSGPAATEPPVVALVGSTLANAGTGSSAADLVIFNNQSLSGSLTEDPDPSFSMSISSNINDATILAEADAVDGGSMGLSGNRISASATGNAASSELNSGNGAAQFDGSVALASQQTNDTVSIEAKSDEAEIKIETINSNAATLSLEDNSSTAVARGNQTNQRLVLNSTALPLGGTTAANLTVADADLTATGAATVSNLQTNTASPVRAVLEDSRSDIDSDNGNNTVGSTLTNANNVHEALALGNSAGNQIALSGTTVGAGAGILSVQRGGTGSTVYAEVDGADNDVNADDINGSTLSLDRNVQSAAGYGNSVSNALTVAANNFADGSVAAALTGVALPVATGAAVVNNLQTRAASVEVNNWGSNVYMSVEEVTGSNTLSNTNNLQEAMALGNSAGNRVSIGGVAEGMASSVGAGAGIVSVQSGEAGATISAYMEGTDNEVNAAGVSGSSMSILQNQQRAAGYGNSVSNALSVAANNFADGSTAAILSPATGATATGAAVISNLQTQAASVTATNDESKYGMEADGVSNGSTLTIDDNLQEAMALRNSANNSLRVTGNAVGAGAGIASVQRGLAGSSVTAEVDEAEINLDIDDFDAVGSSLAVTDNTQRAVAYGNSASNALSVAANGFAEGGSTAAILTGGTAATATGAAVVSNLQTQAASVAANNTESEIDLNIDSDGEGGGQFEQGSLTVERNIQDAQARGNDGSNWLTLGGIADGTAASSVGAGAGIVSAQRGEVGATVAAKVDDTRIYVYSDYDFSDATVSLSNNVQRAAGEGNSVINRLGVNANEFVGSNAAALSAASSEANATGAAVISNLQTQAALVSADNTDSVIRIYSDDDILESTVSIVENTQEAMAVGSSASNALTLAGGNIGTGAGIVSVQRGETGATVTATLAETDAVINVNDDVDSSTLSVRNNQQRATGYGNSAANAVNLSANSISVARSSTVPSTVVASATESATAPSVSASYGILNTQSTVDNVTATTTSNAGVGSSTIRTLGDVEQSSVLNEDNALMAAAYGNESSSRMSLQGESNISVSGSDGEDFYAPVANITSTQDVNANIIATASGQAAALTSIGGSLTGSTDSTGSTVSTSGNSVNAQAIGNLADNLFGSLNADNQWVLAQTGNIDTRASGTTGTVADGTDLRSNASFSVQNVQNGAGNVTATHLDNATAPLDSLSTEVRVEIGGDVSNSTVRADSNNSTASATSNSAFNTLGLRANGMETSTAVQNVQTTNAVVGAVIGAAAVAGTEGTQPIVYNDASGNTLKPQPIANSDYSTGERTLTVTAGESVVFSTEGVAGEEKAALDAYLTTLGFDVNANTATANADEGVDAIFDMSGLRGFQASNNNEGDLVSYVFTGFTQPGVLGTEAIPARGGVLLAVGDDVTGSTLSVADNITNGSAAGNRAVNRSILDGNNVLTDSSLTSATANQDGTTATTVADHALSNLQTSSGAITSTVGGAFAIDAQPDAVISNATLGVSGNSQTATARGNTATNELALQGNTLTSALALQSTQTGSAAVTATSTLDLYAPADVTNSSVAISGNVNTARAVLNNASNSLNVSGNNVGRSVVGSIELVPEEIVESQIIAPAYTGISAEQVLANRQTANAAVTSTADTTLYNQALYSIVPASLDNSTLNVSGNTTQAVALANQALNVATVSGGTQAASVALSNDQRSTQAVTANATTTTNVTLRGDGDGAIALNNSSLLLGGNNTTALAAGNYVDNALNSLASTAYGVASNGTVDLTTDNLAVNANAGMLNRQTNAGAVSATSMDATYQVALNAGASNSSVSMMGNRVAAEAYGNSATNRMTLDALNTGTPTAAVGNYQRNTGAITATVTNVVYGVGFTGAAAVAGNTVRTTGNQITATAVGNSSVSSILAAVR